MNRLLRSLLVLLVMGATRGHSDPMPFDAIRNPLNDTTDQQVRDSVLIRISRLRVNQAGYRTADVGRGEAFVYGVGTSPSFKVIDAATGSDVPGGIGTLVPIGTNVAGSIKVRSSNWAGLATGGDTRYIMNSPIVSGALAQGRLPESLPAGGPYRLVAGSDTSASFVVDDNVYGMVRDGLLKFFGIQRSGFEPSWFHKFSHTRDGSLDGTPGSHSGGWYDCGDHLKEGITMGYSMAMLATLASSLQERDQDHYAANHGQTLRRDGIPDVLRELKVGGDFALKSYEASGKTVASTVTSVGDFGKDHQWWGRPELQDAMPLDRGGATSRALRVELGANILAPYAGGLAVLSKLYRPYDSAYARRALEAAKSFYAEARANPDRSTNTPAYNGSGTNHDDLALAAVFLLWATGDSSYLKDLAYDKSLGDKGSPAFWTSFEGGWMAATDPTLLKGLANHDWGSVHSAALYAFHKLILRDSAQARAFGVRSELERRRLQEKVVFTLICNLADVGSGSGSIVLPKSDLGWKGNVLKFDPTWFSMKTQQDWVWNRYQAGNSSELFFYYDVTGDLEGRPLPNNPANTDWKRDEVRRLLVRQMDFFLGVNPWDMSMILGLGDKNPNHPHHRAANPEGRNTPGNFYKYVVPTGAVYGGKAPDASGVWGVDHYDDYKFTETCLDGAATMIIPAMGLAFDQVDTAGPLAQVKVVYVSDTSAIVTVLLDEWGDVELNLGLDSLAFPRRIASDSPGMSHRFQIGGLTPDTPYWFTTRSVDPHGNVRLQTHFGNGSRFGFRTKATPSTKAVIANVKVCNVTSDSAEILWYTPDGEHESEIRYGAEVPPSSYQFGDEAGVPVKFHRMKIGGLEEKTTYRFSVGSDGVWDDNGGAYYSFTTPVKSVLFDVRTTTYTWGDLPAMGMLVVNQDVVAYDSLEFRIYMRGDSSTMADFAGRVDIGFKYKSDGFIDSAFKQTVDDLLQGQKPVRVPGSCDPAGVCDWFFTIPTGATQMEPGARFRLDVLFVKRNLPWNDDLLNQPPTKALGASDWSWRPHSVAAGDPVDYGGVPVAGKEDVDNFPWTIEPNPYVVVYRKGEFVYGFSPSASLNATKRTDWVLTADFAPPWNVPDGNVVDLAGGKAVHVTGRAEVHDRLTPAAKGAITDIWVNGIRLSDAERARAAVWDPATRDFAIDIAVPMHNGGQQVNVTLFGGAPTCSTTCLESGCAFVDRNYFVNFLSNFTKSALVALDPSGLPVARVVPDSSRLVVRLEDGNANTDRARVEVVRVRATNRRTGRVDTLILTETGLSTGVFVSLPMDVVRAPGTGTVLVVPPEDTLDLLYVDAADDRDSSRARVWSPSAWPVPLAGGIFRSCGGDLEARIRFDRDLAGTSPGDDSLFLLSAGGDSVVLRVRGDSTRWESASRTLVVPLLGLEDGSGWSGRAVVPVSDGSGAVRRTFVGLSDSVGPWIDSAKIVENLDGHPLDTLFVWVGEPLGVPAATLPVEILRGGAPVASPAMDGFRLVDPSSGMWVLTVPAGALREGDEVRLVDRSDLGGNPAGTCPELGRKVGILRRPVRPLLSWIRDSDQDGRADEVVFAFPRRLRAGESPDSVDILFGSDDSARSAGVTGGEGDSILVVRVPPFAFEATRGSDSQGAGTATLRRLGVVESIGKLQDSVGPNLLRAGLRYGPGFDTLDLVFSEPVTAGALGEWLQIRKPAWEILPVESGAIGADALSWRVVVDTFSVVPGDSIRPLRNGRFQDRARLSPAQYHPGVEVMGGDRPPTAGFLLDLDGDGAGETVELHWGRKPRTTQAFVFLWPSRDGTLDTASVGKDGWALGEDPLVSRLAVGPFEVGATASDRTDLAWMASDGGNLAFPLFDRLPPVLTRAVLRYGASDSDFDTLRVDISEEIRWDGRPPLLRLRRNGVDSDLESVRSTVEKDGRSAILLLDPEGAASSRLRRGDSLRLAPASAGTVTDLFGNAQEDPARRVPVEFGRRPPRFEVEFQPRMLRYQGWNPGQEAFQVQVRAAGEEAWRDLGTGLVVDSDRIRRQIGPTITTNQPLRGVAIVYDNLGTFVSSVVLDPVAESFRQGRIPTDVGDRYQVRVAWSGLSQDGDLAASGVYTLRLVLRQNLASEGESSDWTLVNELYPFGWDVPLP
ncbi:MAG: glycoside hydrolase family 9 protein [Fibrobacteria bacterium]|nr:glycoside hydrolase family 9 protein [Fibrobacteria bacterium]